MATGLGRKVKWTKYWLNMKKLTSVASSPLRDIMEWKSRWRHSPKKVPALERIGLTDSWKGTMMCFSCKWKGQCAKIEAVTLPMIRLSISVMLLKRCPVSMRRRTSHSTQILFAIWTRLSFGLRAMGRQRSNLCLWMQVVMYLLSTSVWRKLGNQRSTQCQTSWAISASPNSGKST